MKIYSFKKNFGGNSVSQSVRFTSLNSKKTNLTALYQSQIWKIISFRGQKIFKKSLNYKT